MKTERKYFGKDLEAMSFAQNYHKWILGEFIQYLGDHVAEVGAGMGDFSEFLLGANIKQLVAFEPSDNMFASLEKKFGNNSNVNAINAFFEDQSYHYHDTFDSVCYVNVLEHIKDDREALSHAYKTLHHKGYILIFVPALSFLYSNIDKKIGHYRRYSKKELVEIVTSVGFSIKKVKYFDIVGIILWYVAFVLLKHITTEANVSMYDKLVVPIMRKVEHVITPIIGKNLVLIGQKA
jgi:SAM-dependent methyltransferase